MILGTARSGNIPEKDKAPLSSDFVPNVPDELLKFGMTQRGNDELEKQGKDTSNLHLVAMMTRVGVKLFGVKMEYTYFPPRSGKNALFQMVLMNWPNQGMLWSIFSFPIEYKPQAESIAKECGLRLADGVPHIFDHAGAHTFPLDGETVFTLENIHNHRVYNNDNESYVKLVDEENSLIDEILQGDLNKLKKEFRDGGYSDEQIVRIISNWQDGNEEYDEIPAHKVRRK